MILFKRLTKKENYFRTSLSESLLVLVFVVGLTACSKSPVVKVENQSSVTVSNVVVSGNGFSQTIRSIAPGKTHQLTVLPAGETGVRLTFDAGEKRMDSGAQNYFEANSSYRVHTVINSNLTVTTTTDLKHY